MEMKGYCNAVTVELENGDRYPLFFYEPGRLKQDLQSEINGMAQGWGRPCIAEVGMIVIPSVTEANIRSAVQSLYEDGWFSSLKPLREGSKD